VVLLEDHGLIAHTVAAALEARDIDVRVVDPGLPSDLVATLTDTDPQLALLDLDLGPRGSALDLIGPLVASGVPVAVVTGITDPVRRAECVAEGAVGIVDKSASFEELVGSIERVLDGRPLLEAHEREEQLALLRRHEAERRERLGPFDELTRREAQVLGALMRGWSVDHIARTSFVSVATVRSHVRGVLTKLGVSTQLAATARATEVGWQPPEGD
jgi:two-component system, NarL family, nitrate/nitrite response regulator NarL